MSQTATETAPPPNTVTLQNGQTITFNSNTSISTDEIPIIDVAGIYSSELCDRVAVAEQVREAAHRIGFFYVVNHGVDPAVADTAFEYAKRFFDLPEERKMEVYTGKVPGEYVGYHPMEHYNRNGWKRKGEFVLTVLYCTITSLQVVSCIAITMLPFLSLPERSIS